ncbi:MAG TPA: Clp protease N-terminal domain-containing protein [Candidatus Acidoferrum sp.]|nr:Clp protease N-terminal domain-containing protein [Candidatus Acidoferrum sp.]
MFERYTEHGRRAIFFAKYEAATAGSRSINPEHLALGLLWDAYPLVKYLNSNAMTLSDLRAKLGVGSKHRKPLTMKDTIPLSSLSKEIVRESAVASDDLGQRHIGPEHLMLALLKIEKSFLDKMLPGGHADLSSLRSCLTRVPPPLPSASAKGNCVTVESVLTSLTAAVDDMFLAYLADQLQFRDVDGNLVGGRNAFMERKKDILEPLSGKKVTFRVEDKERESSGIRICTLLWKEANNGGQCDEGVVRMTGLFSVGNNGFSIFLIQLALSTVVSKKERLSS